MATIDSARHREGAPQTGEKHEPGREAPPLEPDNRGEPPRAPDGEKEVGSLSAWAAAIRRRPAMFGALSVLVLILAAGGLSWWLNIRHFESTDDAFIDTRAVQISPEIAGQIVEVPVTDNQLVDAGATLLRIDQRNYEAAFGQARGTLAEAKARVDNFDAQIVVQQSQIEQAQQQVDQAHAALQFARQEDERYQQLLKQGSGTEQRAQQSASDLRQRVAALAAAEASLVTANKQLEVLHTQRDGAAAQVTEAEAALERAQADLSRTTIVAPEKGRVAKLTAAKGGYAQPGQTLMMFVPQRAWVTANFKETQLADMRPGQPVDIEIDAYPGRTFHGHVDSIQPGSGTVFSLLPAENATGNFVKVVQRVPVKIVFDAPADVYLGPGMSVVPQVRVR